MGGNVLLSLGLFLVVCFQILFGDEKGHMKAFFCIFCKAYKGSLATTLLKISGRKKQVSSEAVKCFLSLEAENNVTHCFYSFPKLQGSSELNLMFSCSNYLKLPLLYAFWFSVYFNKLTVYVMFYWNLPKILSGRRKNVSYSLKTKTKTRPNSNYTEMCRLF